jgi:hypothetical protein
MQQKERFMLKNNEDRLEAYRKSLVEAWAFNDYKDWPIKFNSIMHLFLKEFAEEFIEDLNELQKKGISTEDIGKAFGNPARVYRSIHSVIYGMKQMKLDLSYQREIVLSLLDIVKTMKYDSEFNEGNENIILSPNEITTLNKVVNFYKPSPQESNILQRFCGIIWAYAEVIFFRVHDVTKEFHGLYHDETDTKKKILIREYLNLNPKDIWTNIPLLPFNSIKIFTKYDNNIEVSIDSYNHINVCKGSFIESLTDHAIECDGKSISLKELQSFLPIILQTIEEINNWVDKSNWKEITNRYADVYWYRKKPLKDLLECDWQVPGKVRERIKVGNINEKMSGKLSKDQIHKLICTII